MRHVFLQLKEKLDKSLASVERLEDEKRQLRESLDEVENELSKAELERRSMEGHIQKLKMTINDKETETQVSQPTQLNWLAHCASLWNA